MTGPAVLDAHRQQLRQRELAPGARAAGAVQAAGQPAAVRQRLVQQRTLQRRAAPHPAQPHRARTQLRLGRPPTLSMLQIISAALWADTQEVFLQ